MRGNFCRSSPHRSDFVADSARQAKFDILCLFSVSALRKRKICRHRICKINRAMHSVPHLLLAPVPLHRGARASGSFRVLRSPLRRACP